MTAYGSTDIGAPPAAINLTGYGVLNTYPAMLHQGATDVAVVPGLAPVTSYRLAFSTTVTGRTTGQLWPRGNANRT